MTNKKLYIISSIYFILFLIELNISITSFSKDKQEVASLWLIASLLSFLCSYSYLPKKEDK